MTSPEVGTWTFWWGLGEDMQLEKKSQILKADSLCVLEQVM